MSLYVACQCGQAFNAPPELAGQTLPCPSCQRPLTVPGGAPAPELAPLGMTPGHDPFAIGSAGASPSQFGGDPFGGPARLDRPAPGGFGVGADPFGGNMALPTMPAGLAPGPQKAQPQMVQGEEDSPLLVWGSILGGGGALLLVIGLLIYNGTRKRSPAAATTPSQAMSTPATSPAMTTPEAVPPMATSPPMPMPATTPSEPISPIPLSPMPAAEGFGTTAPVASAAFVPPTHGKNITSNDSQFLIWFPDATPEMNSSFDLLPDGQQARTQSYESAKQGVHSYQLREFSFSEPQDLGEMSTATLEGMRAACRALGAQSLNESTQKLAGLDATIITFQARNDAGIDMEGKAQMVVTPQCGFIFVAIGSKEFMASDDMRLFFASFRRKN